ncbi:hypothetical protein N657DRAFT_694574 [Parathielavia appendiculata]|uniref:Uncharacterized protein n=1 Tax=Parathielavia appendiculata TaxID=2587402 RepID=A0AAN6YYF6_9PEZI|nr:hypothetical protein N657DRAFT_694574 [Parathielavia appendiculata]
MATQQSPLPAGPGSQSPPIKSCTAHPIPDAVLRSVYASDQAMYPVSLPYTTLRAWVDACPDLAIGFSREGDGPGAAAAVAQVAGVVIVLPITRIYWEDLLQGRLKEADVDSRTMFPRPGGGGGDQGEEAEREEVGLHVYHVERYGNADLCLGEGEAGERTGYLKYALKEVVRRVQARFDWKVVGISALTATPAGKRAFERLGFTPTGYRELFVTKGAGEGSADGMGDQVLQTRMICHYPDDEEDPVLAGGAAITSTSEMTVMYGNLSDVM